MKRVFIGKFNGKEEIKEKILEALNWIQIDAFIKAESKVFIKPNFTYPRYKEGVTTSPDVIEALIKILRDVTPHIVIGESDGGYYSWKAEDAFKGHGIDIIEKKYDIKSLNLSNVERTYLPVSANGKLYHISFPKILKDETDIFITMPVPKVHCMTGVSLAMKNQWGCIPDTMRLSFHHIFNEAILEINKNLPQTFVVGDGKFFLDNTGPMYGKPIKKDLIIASNDIGSFEVVMCEIMGVDINKIPHLKFAKEKGFLPGSIDEIELNCPLDNFKYKSTLKRSLRNKIMYNCFRSEFLTYLLYTSYFGKMLHKVFYKLRGTPEHLKNIEQGF
ncbi:MAG: hypothetical protein DDT23_01009 [candidate division WS2 bacterium]|nr:hypothetical protein [Candidatus Lithacetigena glycinireducens]